jgi:ribosomal 30S subunit maturation factor RimM
VRETKFHSGTLLAKLEGIDNPERAKSFKGRRCRSAAEAGEGRYYWTDLLGLKW